MSWLGKIYEGIAWTIQDVLAGSIYIYIVVLLNIDMGLAKVLHEIVSSVLISNGECCLVHHKST